MAQSMESGVTNFQDSFYKKDFLLEKITLLRMAMGDKIFPEVLLGKDGWMEYTGERNIDDFQNLEPFENEKQIEEGLTTLNQYLKTQGITLLVVIAPNKASIYPDKLPEQIKSLHGQSRFDTLMSYLEDNDLPTVDLRPALRNARQDQDVYYKTNTHWNGYGAFIAYTTIIDTLRTSHPDLKPYEISELNLVAAAPDVQDISKLMHANFIKEPTFFYSPMEPFVRTLHLDDKYGYNQSSWILDSKLPTLLMFHDSFGEYYLNNYLSMNFSKSNFIQNKSILKYLTRESLQYFKPDIIIVEIVERYLSFFPDCTSDFASK
jgi:hypothetical protein